MQGYPFPTRSLFTNSDALRMVKGDASEAKSQSVTGGRRRGMLPGENKGVLPNYQRDWFKRDGCLGNLTGPTANTAERTRHAKEESKAEQNAAKG